MVKGKGLLLSKLPRTTAMRYLANIGEPKYIKQTLTDIKGEIDSNNTSEDFNSPLTSMDRKPTRKY